MLPRKNTYNLKDYYETNRVTPHNYLNLKKIEKSENISKPKSTKAFRVDLRDYSVNKSINFIKNPKYSRDTGYRDRSSKQKMNNLENKRKSLSPRCQAVTDRLYDYRMNVPCNRCSRHNGSDIGLEMRRIVQENGFIKRYLSDEEIRDVCL